MRYSLLLAALCVGAFLPAQNQNFTLVRNWKRSAGLTYNDVWGYTAPDGREFAIVGETAGIWIVETTDPNNLQQIAWYSAPSSTWRDMHNWKNYIYVSTENRTQRGFRVIDMANPSSPVDHGYVQTSTFINAHNTSIDQDRGIIYFSGSNQGVAIYDAAANPTNPPLINNWSTLYTHDICIRRGRAYFALGYSYQVRIFDVRNPLSLVQLGTCNTPGGYAHNSWVSDDDQILCCTDEIARGSNTPHMTVWDISNPASPVQKGDYDLGSSYIVHNVFMIGRTAYMSQYLCGVHMVDIANPTTPTRVGRYDTSTVASGYAGCWGIYPFSESGLVYASDMQNGLFVFRVECGHLNRYEVGTKGSNNLVPRARFDGATPKVNASGLQLVVENLKPNARCFLLLGARSAKLNLLGVQVNVDLNGSFLFEVRADANGVVRMPTPVPNNPTLGNSKIYLQVFGEDTGMPQGLSASRGMWVGICQ
ncbi:MAG: choice-of-anchor B family protein [Planctomycetes bacterium]|nr:choice-of-anchor B family protein [Planctomycetota bacterium]